MQESERQFDIKNFLAVLLRRRYVFAAVFVLVVSSVVAASYLLPKKYRADTIVLVEASPVVNPLNDANSPDARASARLALIRQLLFNRRSIERVMNKLDLDAYVRNASHYESMIEDVRSSLDATIKGSNLFQISYVGDRPDVVRDVVNTLASQYIEDSLQSRRQGSSVSMSFHTDQLKYYNEKLDAAETALKRFKEKNASMLPRRTDVNLGRIQNMQTSLMETRLRLKELEMKKKTLEGRLSGEDPLIVAMISEEGGIAARVEALEKHLTLLLARYTENYPEVIKTKAEIEELKARLNASGGKELAAPSGVKTTASNPIYQGLREDLIKTETEITTLQAREKELGSEIARLEKSVKNIPGEEQELIRLERDSKAYEAIYNTLLAKFEEAKISKEMDTREEALIFKVVDPAVLPLRPFRPDRVLYIIFGLFAGVASGAGVIYVMENYLDTSFKSLDDLEEGIGVPVLGAIPAIVIDSDRAMVRKRDLIVLSATSLYTAVILGLLAREVARRYGMEVLSWVR